MLHNLSVWLAIALVLGRVLVFVQANGGPSRSDPEIGIDRQVGNFDSLRKQERDEPSKSSSTVISSNSSTSTSTVTYTPSASAIFTPPRPFDSGLGDNFTQSSCTEFFNDYITQNSTLQACVPFSLLLQNSGAFFQATAMSTTLTPILDASCNAPFDQCSSVLSSLANRILSSNACGDDYSRENPLVIRAYNGLLSYAPMYKAACLKADPIASSTGDDFPYCYESAFNSSSQADWQLYYLPLAVDLPAGSSVSCSACVQKTMAIFAGTASNSTSPLNKDYIGAARMINAACGDNFVNSSASVLTSSSKSDKSMGQRNAKPGRFTPTIWCCILILICSCLF